MSIPSITIRVPASGVVRVPVAYAHEFASIPIAWREVATSMPLIVVPVVLNPVLASYESIMRQLDQAVRPL